MNKRTIVVDEIRGIYKIGEKDVQVMSKKITKTYKNRNNKNKVDVSYNKVIFVDF